MEDRDPFAPFPPLGGMGMQPMLNPMGPGYNLSGAANAAMAHPNPAAHPQPQQRGPGMATVAGVQQAAQKMDAPPPQAAPMQQPGVTPQQSVMNAQMPK